MGKTHKRLLSLLLAVVMATAMISTTALAYDDEDDYYYGPSWDTLEYWLQYKETHESRIAGAKAELARCNEQVKTLDSERDAVRGQLNAAIAGRKANGGTREAENALRDSLNAAAALVEQAKAEKAQAKEYLDDLIAFNGQLNRNIRDLCNGKCGCDGTCAVQIFEGRDATCEENGQTTGVRCAVCHTWLQDQEVIEATGHNFVWKSGPYNHFLRCTICNQKDTETIAEHTWGDNGHCTVCGRGR